jgi:hypothetical protein
MRVGGFEAPGAAVFKPAVSAVLLLSSFRVEGDRTPIWRREPLEPDRPECGNRSRTAIHFFRITLAESRDGSRNAAIAFLWNLAVESCGLGAGAREWNEVQRRR